MPIFITFPVVSANRGEYFIKCFRDQSKECLDCFERSLSNYVDAFVVGNDINNAIYLFLEKLYDMYNYYCPILKENVSGNKYLKACTRDSQNIQKYLLLVS